MLTFLCYISTELTANVSKINEEVSKHDYVLFFLMQAHGVKQYNALCTTSSTLNIKRCGLISSVKTPVMEVANVKLSELWAR